MRHNINAGFTGLENCNLSLLNNKGNLPKEFLEEALETFFKNYGYLDFNIEKDEILIGVEPAYQGQDLKIIGINKDIFHCYSETGHAFGAYGTGIRSRKKYYGHYKNNCKFSLFIDKWHKELFKEQHATK